MKRRWCDLVLNKFAQDHTVRTWDKQNTLQDFMVSVQRRNWPLNQQTGLPCKRYWSIHPFDKKKKLWKYCYFNQEWLCVYTKKETKKQTNKKN